MMMIQEETKSRLRNERFEDLTTNGTWLDDRYPNFH